MTIALVMPCFEVNCSNYAIIEEVNNFNEFQADYVNINIDILALQRIILLNKTWVFNNSILFAVSTVNKQHLSQIQRINFYYLFLRIYSPTEKANSYFVIFKDLKNPHCLANYKCVFYFKICSFFAVPISYKRLKQLVFYPWLESILMFSYVQWNNF